MPLSVSSDKLALWFASSTPGGAYFVLSVTESWRDLSLFAENIQVSDVLISFLIASDALFPCRHIRINSEKKKHLLASSCLSVLLPARITARLPLEPHSRDLVLVAFTIKSAEKLRIC